MAKKKKTKWPYKYVSVDKVNELENLSKEALLQQALRFDTNLKAEEKNKKTSETLSSLKKTISQHNKHWADSNEGFNRAKDDFDYQKEIRDAEISDTLEDKKDIEAGFNDVIKNFKEHRDVCMKLLKAKK